MVIQAYMEKAPASVRDFVIEHYNCLTSTDTDVAVCIQDIEESSTLPCDGLVKLIEQTKQQGCTVLWMI